MIARCVSYTETRATVVLEPSWLARAFGARTVSVDLVRPSTAYDSEWRTAATGRRTSNIDHGAEIRNALDFREVGSEPRRVRSLIGGAVAP